MYQVIPIQRLISVVAFVAGVVLVMLLWASPPKSLADWFKYIGSAATASATIIVVIGQKWVFHHFWRLRPAQAILFPYIAGEWVGSTSSNWPVIEAMTTAFAKGGAPHPPDELDVAALGTKDKRIEVTIEADLFRVSMRLRTVDDYSSSYTIVVKPQRAGPLGVPRLFYIFHNDTPEPVYTDTGAHIGAAYLDIKQSDGRVTMDGTYWTARNWTTGKNSAGRIALRRPS